MKKMKLKTIKVEQTGKKLLKLNKQGKILRSGFTLTLFTLSTNVLKRFSFKKNFFRELCFGNPVYVNKILIFEV